MAALYEREKTGKGRHVETSMFEAMCHFNLDDFTHYLAVDQIMGPYSRPHVSQSYVFECADGGWIALHMSSPPKFWENLATAMGVPDMLQRPEFESRPARIENYDKVIEFLAPIFKTQSRSYWDDRLAELEVPHSPILNSKEVLEGPLGQHHGRSGRGRQPARQVPHDPLTPALRRRDRTRDHRAAGVGRGQRGVSGEAVESIPLETAVHKPLSYICVTAARCCHGEVRHPRHSLAFSARSPRKCHPDENRQFI